MIPPMPRDMRVPASTLQKGDTIRAGVQLEDVIKVSSKGSTTTIETELWPGGTRTTYYVSCNELFTVSRKQ